MKFTKGNLGSVLMDEKSLGDKRNSFDKAPTDLGRKMALRLTISTLTLVISVPEFIKLLIREGGNIQAMGLWFRRSEE